MDGARLGRNGNQHGVAEGDRGRFDLRRRLIGLDLAFGRLGRLIVSEVDAGAASYARSSFDPERLGCTGLAAGDLVVVAAEMAQLAIDGNFGGKQDGVAEGDRTVTVIAEAHGSFDFGVGVSLRRDGGSVAGKET